MIRDRKDYPELMTPAAPTIWPALNEPDYKFKKDTGEYHVRLLITPELLPAFQPIVDAATEIRDEALEKKREELSAQKKGATIKKLNTADVLRPEVDPETGEETGNYILRAALPARIDIKQGPKAGQSFNKRVDIFSASGKKLKNPPRIGGGSVVKAAIVPMDYWFPKDATIGVSFELKAVQVLKLVDGGGNNRSASDYGFGAEEGDEIEDQPENANSRGAENSGSDDDDDGGDF